MQMRFLGFEMGIRGKILIAYQYDALVRPASEPSPISAGFGKWFFVALLFLTVILASGCASVNGHRRGVAGGGSPTDARTDRLPFPASSRTTAIEPTVVGYTDYRDPLIGLNRAVFAFNDVTYRYLLIPLSKGYVRVVPEPVRQSVDNFFYNIKMPIYAVNHLLQVKPKPLGRNLLRFGINTTVGLLGLFDPAKAWFDLEREETNFDETFARYGFGYGIYLVLPIFGPSDVRNSVSIVLDYFIDPITYLTENPERSAIQGYDFFQEYAPGAEQYNMIRRKSEDPYIFFRNLYLQGVQRDVDY
jgi:phospholipid-binding lipoprotein MlaA